ncbi:MAG: DEAD/DEAH box helicase [Lawsonibacter sp.]|nr:DEAD/DEAH box helicase [Lawsonibacter sp.]
MTFLELGLSAPILSALNEQDYKTPSPIQEKAIPPALAGRDVLGCAQTGTGKTCAFATPILQRLDASPAPGHPIRALILTPTRELAIQIGESFVAYGRHLKLRHTVIFGGVGQNPQVEALKRGVDILVATPGRLMDLYDQGFVHLNQLEIFVLDEADRMLDMGFIHDVKKILKWLPSQKQTMLFSATMPPEISDLVNSLLKNPVRVAVDPISSPVEAIRQSVYLVDKVNKSHLLANLVRTKGIKNALVFTRTKHGANKVACDLEKEGISAAAIHGNKSQTARQQALADFKSGSIQCLVATDIAARGLDIEELSHVFNYNLPEVPETYVHRIGRTGRAGRGGEAIAFCDFSEKPLLKEVEKLIGRKIPLVVEHPFPMQLFEAPKKDKHGRLINEEDAEARVAAKTLRLARDQAKQTAAPAKAPAAPKPAPERSTESTSSGTSRRRKKRASGNESSASALPAESSASFESRPKMTRSGKLLDTGDAMPCTEFHRPNPLDSDVIMDATARLLAPRRVTLTPARSPQDEKRDGSASSRPRRRNKKPAVQASHPPTSEETTPRPSQAAEDRRPRKMSGSASTPAPEQRRSAPDRNGHRDRGGSRGKPPESHRPQPKDSTEQPSLMKPYYLDIGR